MLNTNFQEIKTEQMDKGGAIFNFITSCNCIKILGLLLIISLPLLIYQSSGFDSVWRYRKIDKMLPEEKPPSKITPETAPWWSSSQPPQDLSFAVAPTPTGTQNRTVKDSGNVYTINKTLANSTQTSSLHTSNLKNHTKPTSTSNSTTSNKLLDGLLALGFNARSCLSRYESHLYRKPSQHKPSSLLVSKLRNYERLHRRCGPKSGQYKRTLRMLATTKQISNTKECNYIVWLPVNGLGNQMVSLASTFLYAVLTNRVILVAFESKMSGVFCEPFLNSTWKLPKDFPHRHRIDDLPTYASMVKRVIGIDKATNLANSMVIPPFLYVDLQHRGEEYERFFHCGEGQMILKRVSFLVLRSDQYFAPSLFMISSFQQTLNVMFPEKDTVFHHLARYLYHPSNEAWKQIMRFYKANLLMADKKVGIQVRVFAEKLTPAKTITEQILACTQKNNILPKVSLRKEVVTSKNDTFDSMAVLVTSLHKDYSENLRAFYKNDEGVRVYQLSHEEVQRFNNNTHHVKALTEMYLLSLCDKLVTSGLSTFGYVAQGLGGMKPWIMYKTVGTKFWDPPCERALSMEPCFHFPPKYDCESRIEVEHISSVFPYMRRCEDFGIGVKLVIDA